MAVRDGNLTTDNDGVAQITWAGLLNGDTGAWVRAGRFNDKTVQVIVVAAGAGDEVTMEGSPDDGTTTGELHDPQGGLLSAVLTGATISDAEVISESPYLIRPDVTGGDGVTNLTVVITAPTRGK